MITRKTFPSRRGGRFSPLEKGSKRGFGDKRGIFGSGEISGSKRGFRAAGERCSCPLRKFNYDLWEKFCIV